MIDTFLEIENLVPSSFADDLEDIFLSDYFPWYYNKNTVADNFYYGNNKDVIESPQFTHTIIMQNREPSVVLKDVKPIVYFLEEKLNLKIQSVDRIKANLLQPFPNFTARNFNPPHWDADYRIQPNTLSMVYYVNDSDGETVLFNKQLPDDANNLSMLHKSTPKKGKCVIFPSNRWHSSSNPVNNDRRVILNFVLEV